MRNRSRRIGLAVLASLAVLPLSGCIVGEILGESSTTTDLYNPQDGRLATCGRPMHRGSPSREELRELDACLAKYRAQGYRELRNEDLNDPRVRKPWSESGAPEQPQ